MATMTAAEKLGYRHDKRSANLEFSQLAAQRGLAKSHAYDEYARQARDVNVDYKRIRTSMPTIYNQRGFLRSGLFTEAKRLLAAERARKISDALAARNRVTQKADLDISQGRAQLQSLLEMVDAREEARLADLAAIVDGVQL